MGEVKRSRLLTKVLIGEVLLFAAIGLITSGLAAYTLYTRLSSEFLSKGTAIANSIANASDELILTRDASTIQSLVDQFREIRGVGYVFVVDGDGVIVSHTFVPAVPAELQAIERLRWTDSGADQIRQQDIRVKGGGDYIDVAAPVLAGVAGSVHVGMDRGIIRADITSAILTQLLVLVAIFVVAVAVAGVVVGRISRPLSALTAHAHQVAGQSFEAGFDADEATLGPLASGRDEIGELARAFLAMERVVSSNISRLRQLAGELAHYNETLEATVATRTSELQEKNTALQKTLEELKQAQEQMVRQEKMASLGALTAGIAHEIKNPLNFVNNFADLSRELAGELREDLELEGTRARSEDRRRRARHTQSAAAEPVEDQGARRPGGRHRPQHAAALEGHLGRSSSGSRPTSTRSCATPSTSRTTACARSTRISRSAWISTSIRPPADRRGAAGPDARVPQHREQRLLRRLPPQGTHRRDRPPHASRPARWATTPSRCAFATTATASPTSVRARDLRAVLHDQARRARHRPGPLHLPRHHRRAAPRRAVGRTARGQFTEFIIVLPNAAQGGPHRSKNVH